MTARELTEAWNDATNHFSRLNLYMTPGFEKAFDVHFDTEDIFILQIQGTKQWYVYQNLKDLKNITNINDISNDWKYPIDDWHTNDLNKLRNKLKPVLNITLKQGFL